MCSFDDSKVTNNEGSKIVSNKKQFEWTKAKIKNRRAKKERKKERLYIEESDEEDKWNRKGGKKCIKKDNERKKEVLYFSERAILTLTIVSPKTEHAVNRKRKCSIVKSQ